MVPFAFEAGICTLSVKVAGVAMPGVSTPALGLPYPSLLAVPSLAKTLVVYGGSSSVGSMTTQLAKAAGIDVIAIAGSRNFDLSKSCGASQVFDHKDIDLVDKIVDAVGSHRSNDFVGIFDVIATPDTFVHDLNILERLGGGHLACTHPPPSPVPASVKAGMIFAVHDVATPMWEDYLTPALQAGKLQCLPVPTVVGKGLEAIQEAMKISRAGVSATKLVVEL